MPALLTVGPRYWHGVKKCQNLASTTLYPRVWLYAWTVIYMWVLVSYAKEAVTVLCSPWSRDFTEMHVFKGIYVKLEKISPTLFVDYNVVVLTILIYIPIVCPVFIIKMVNLHVLISRHRHSRQPDRHNLEKNPPGAVYG